ncbi:hsp70-binding protein 1-like [Anopheles bellator]|uniref:hsp70-binding protein 1-like n=1 Tax=Anopheles bellator TaxID=139047 RepID=UPI002649EF48|nr:hsp70-binding protein 1-like [Anopheles bellator]
MASGDNPDQPRHPRSLQGLLKFAMEATKDEDAPREHSMEQMDEERRQFLELALNTVTVDVATEFEKAVQIFEDRDAADEAKVDALEACLEYVQDLDAANDFFQIGGFQIIRPGLESSNANIRSCMLRLIGAMTQHNPFCQLKMLEMDILPKLMEMLSDEPKVAENALHAMSCLIRHCDQAIVAFMAIGGVECILRCMEVGSEKLKACAAFLTTGMVTSYPASRDEFIKLDAVEIFMGIIKPTTKDYDPELDTALYALKHLIECDEAKQRCSSEEGFKEKLDTIIEHSRGNSACEEILRCSQFILKRCFSDHNDETGR